MVGGSAHAILFISWLFPGDPTMEDGVHDVNVLGQVWRSDVEAIEAVEGTTSHSI
jgi:hypothetical protein